MMDVHRAAFLFGPAERRIGRFCVKLIFRISCCCSVRMVDDGLVDRCRMISLADFAFTFLSVRQVLPFLWPATAEWHSWCSWPLLSLGYRFPLWNSITAQDNAPSSRKYLCHYIHCQRTTTTFSWKCKRHTQNHHHQFRVNHFPHKDVWINEILTWPKPIVNCDVTFQINFEE